MRAPRHERFEALRRYIISRREALGMTQREVAKRGDFSPGILGKLEAGSVQSIPNQETLEKIAKGLDVAYEVLDHLARGLPVDSAVLELSPDAESLRLYEAWKALPPERRRVALKVIEGLGE